MSPERDDFLAAPLACLFFQLLTGTDRPVQVATNPRSALALAAETRRLLDPWTGELAANIRASFAAGPAIADLVDAVIHDPRAAWWLSPAAGSEQIWPSSSFDRSPSVTPPRGDNPRWQAYAQVPVSWFHIDAIC
jgi:hypothetical protein